MTIGGKRDKMTVVVRSARSICFRLVSIGLFGGTYFEKKPILASGTSVDLLSPGVLRCFHNFRKFCAHQPRNNRSVLRICRFGNLRNGNTRIHTYGIACHADRNRYAFRHDHRACGASAGIFHPYGHQTSAQARCSRRNRLLHLRGCDLYAVYRGRLPVYE